MKKEPNLKVNSCSKEYCSKCNGTGFMLNEKNNSYSRCECYKMARIKEMWERSGISLGDMDKSFKEFTPWNSLVAEMKELCMQYYKSFDEIKSTKQNSLLLCGNPGCGKTHLELALANNFVKNKGTKVIYMPYRDVITSIKQSLIDEVNYLKKITKYKECELLMIDDLFKGKITESDINIMFEIINHRYLNNLPMMISTEFNSDRILNFDEALGSRIVEMCKGHMKEVIGRENNYRLR
ncbi:ATP-binding protein [uncultured Clostridium sp.]|jgi:DNA replication protein DnaC|uniref:ATP-binding protein n=1 Tax=uncultured Clostridium sp. TaxID=59620 RepID=UPI00261AC724|nr:ATP-binding protein [uncultured Clostridium sp.]